MWVKYFKDLMTYHNSWTKSKAKNSRMLMIQTFHPQHWQVVSMSQCFSNLRVHESWKFCKSRNSSSNILSFFRVHTSSTWAEARWQEIWPWFSMKIPRMAFLRFMSDQADTWHGLLRWCSLHIFMWTRFRYIAY